MYLSARPTESADFERCFALARDRALYRPGEERQLFTLWEEVLKEGQGTSAVVEDEDRPPGRRIVGFGLDVFVASWFIDQAPTLPPYLGPHLLQLRATGRSPILTPAEVSEAAAGEGLNVLGLHSGWAEEDLSREEIHRVWHLVVETFAIQHRGLNLRSFCSEMYGERDRDFMGQLGARVWNDFEGFFAQNPAARPPADRHPYLVGMMRSEALAQAGTLAFAAFFPTAPRFAFTARQQQVLRCALAGHTDAAIAAELGVSLVTVKKLWGSIYVRVQDRDAGALPLTLPPPCEGQQRGSEKRRFLLNYLRSHPEELRPLQPPRRRGA